ncbi:MAG: glycosyltransferase [Caldilineaceae bacterium]
MHVSVILTVYNERRSIERLLASLAQQTHPPDEVVICDGGSTDGTVAAIQNYCARFPGQLPNLRILIEPGANISRGRNLAIQASVGPLIAVTDAGVRLSPAWLEHLVAPWQNSQRERQAQQQSQQTEPLAVAGFFLPDVKGKFETAMAATVLPLTDDIDPAKFLPSSRSVAFTKAAWEKVGGYPEWLDYCEDLIFDIKMNDLAKEMQRLSVNSRAPRPALRAPSAFTWAPDALVYFRPRESLRAFWTQYYRYARGDGKADLWRKRHLIRYITYLVLLPALLGHAFWGFFARWLGWVGLLIGIAIYCWRPWQRLQVLGKNLNWRDRVIAALWSPVIRMVGDVAKMVGYPVGLWWRWRHRNCSEVDWRN